MFDSLQTHGLYSPWNYLDQNTRVVVFPFSRDCPNPGIKPRSPILQVESLPAELQGKPKNTEVGSLSLSLADLPNPGIKPSLLWYEDLN